MNNLNAAEKLKDIYTSGIAFRFVNANRPAHYACASRYGEDHLQLARIDQIISSLSASNAPTSTPMPF